MFGWSKDLKDGIREVRDDGPLGRRFDLDGDFDTGPGAWRGLGHDRTRQGSDRNDVLIGSNQDDTLSGGKGSDLLLGFGGDDRLFGGRDTDLVWGGSGDDDIRGGSHGDWLFGGRGADTILGQTGDDFAWGGSGKDTIHGGRGHDWLSGGRGDDLIAGGPGRDLLAGGAGDDTLIGGPGRDTLIGGDGRDTMIIEAGHWTGDQDTDLLLDPKDDQILFAFDEAVASIDFMSAAFAKSGPDELTGSVRTYAATVEDGLVGEADADLEYVGAADPELVVSSLTLADPGQVDAMAGLVGRLDAADLDTAGLLHVVVTTTDGDRLGYATDFEGDKGNFDFAFEALNGTSLASILWDGTSLAMTSETHLADPFVV